MSELLGIARFKFHEGKVEEFKRLSAQAMEIVRAKDTGDMVLGPLLASSPKPSRWVSLGSEASYCPCFARAWI
jgi:hypothetical protein